MARPLLIGLTGGIASGKTTVGSRFIQLGVAVIDADAVAREVVAPGEPGLARVVEKFGATVLDSNGKLNRPALRSRVFADPVLRKELEVILHPLIKAEMARRAAMVEAPYIVLAIPLLVETGNPGRVDRILVVDVNEDRQLTRLIARDHASLAEARSILAAQASRASRLEAADDVLINDGTIADLHQEVDALHQNYLRLAAAGCEENPT